MFQLANQIPMQKVLESTFSDKAAIFNPEYPRAAILRTMREELRQKLRVVSGPQYWGEAEVLILNPLFEVTAEAATPDSLGHGLVAAKAYALSAAYALIANVCAVTEERKIAEIISLSSISSNDLVKSLMNYMGESKNGRGDEEASVKAAEIWGQISKLLSKLDVTAEGAQSDTKKNPVAVMYNALKMPQVEQTDETVRTLFDAFVSVLRQGKGLPLTREDRRTVMGRWAAFISNIDVLIENNGDSFIDAYTALYWALQYMDIKDDYEAVFPSSTMRLMSSLWMKSISQRCVHMAKFYFKLATCAAYFDLALARRSVDEQMAFYHPILERNLSAYKDLEAKWAEASDHIEKSAEPFAFESANALYDELKAYIDVKYFLPRSSFEAVFNMVAQKYNYTDSPTDEDIIVSKVGEEATTVLNVSDQVLLDHDSAVVTQAALATYAQGLLDYVQFLDKAKDSLRIITVTGEPVWSAIIPPHAYTSRFPLSGHIGDIRPADFKMHSPYELLTDKYIVQRSEGASTRQVSSTRWIWVDYLMKPINKVPALLHLAKLRSQTARIVWPHDTDLPVGDPITNPYLRVPIPACYTESRASMSSPATINGLLGLLAGDSANSMGARQFFFNLAALLARVSSISSGDGFDQDSNPYLLPIINSLSGIMFVYVRNANQDAGNDVMLMPSLPTIYGMPTSIMRDKNKLSAEEMNSISATSTFLVAPDSRAAKLTCEGYTFTFVLHRWYPKPGEFRSLMVPFSRATYVACPLLTAMIQYLPADVKNALSSYITGSGSSTRGKLTDIEIDTIVNSVKTATLKKDVPSAWVENHAFYPALMVLPHILWDYDGYDPNIADEYFKLATLSVRAEWDEYLKTMRIAGFWTSPAIILDLSDYMDARNSPDPSPLDASNVSKPSDPEPLEPQPSRADVQPAPEPESIAPAPHIPGSAEPDTVQQLKQLETISSAPVIAKNREKAAQPVVTKPEGADAASSVVEASGSIPSAMAGDASSGDKTGASTQDAAHHEDHYWKKLDDKGDVLDVVKSDQCPEGYVPATEEEYAAFKKGSKAEKENVDDASAASE